MTARTLARLITAPLLATALALPAAAVVGAPAQAGTAPAGTATAKATAAPASTAANSGWKPRPEQYAGTSVTKDLAIPMSDGVKLRGDLTLPADASGKAATGRFPVVVTITAYNKTVIAGGFGSTLAGAEPAYLVKRGYAQLTVDARGTGSSEGSWGAFSARENKDAGEVMTWAHSQPWSSGSTAMTGASYMGISQIFAASAKPAGLKAIFPQVPGADVYRDVVAAGGQVDVGFMPLWLGLVTVSGIIPPAVTASDPQSGLGTLLTHLQTGATFSGKLLLEAILGGEPAYDGPFYAERSPINVVSQVDVPTFLISGEFDLFQRGTPLLFENLQRRGVPTKMIIGPWDHLQGSSGAQVGDAGHGSLAELQLRWFDHYVLGLPDPGLDSDIAPITYFEQGPDTWRTTDSWVGRDRAAATFGLSGSAANGQPGVLTAGTPTPGTANVLPIPVAGLCSRSMNQWTAGLVNAGGFPNPCLKDNAPNDQAGVVFETAPLTEPLAFQGPINARLHVSSSGADGMLSVAVEDVAPDGTVTRLTGGWQTIAHRALDTGRSRYLDGQLIQAFHPFTAAAKKPVAGGEIVPVDVEIFPTGAAIRPGHRLRIAVQGFDVPHLLPTLPDLLGALSVVTIHNSPAHPSTLTLPVVRSAPGPGTNTPGTNTPGTTAPGTTAPNVRPAATTSTTVRLAKATTKRRARNTATVRVTSSRMPAGVVDVLVDGKRVRSAQLRNGAAKVALPKLKRKGTHRVTAQFRGSPGFSASNGRTVTWRVR